MSPGGSIGAISWRRAPAAATPPAPLAGGDGGAPHAGPLPAPLREVPRLLLQAWLGLDEPGQLRVSESDHGLRDTPGARLLIAGTRFAAGDREHAAVALLLASQQQLDAAGGNAPAPPPDAGVVAQMAGTRLHWGSCRGEGARWTGRLFGRSGLRGGAWQSAFHVVPTPAGPVHALLLQLTAEDGGPHGVAAIVKAPGNRWLGDAATRRDFFIDLSAFPRSEALVLPKEGASEEGAAAASAALREPALRLLSALSMRDAWAPLSAAELARAPPPRGAGAAKAAVAVAAKERRAKAAKAGLPRQPELPPPWAEGPPRDKTQVVTLGGDQLAAAAVARLVEWAARQEGRRPLGGPEGLPLA
ncbi:hypothetical protein MNEG_9829 [Monoraphidium neglectum]|uniref:Uncharacterized protein n=1 Tax=Monoraphidium neglectum TaxID=145388 RepID=A0A0D2MUU6_9CHLO|nr:hypothetical protein MNEG_9829 [Monoraphidium neglectum]KIY98135.1 hypothetical protein MNEG_9829 [Monoraphidium neglectum]|eukprot:XP_013897155.1 hypothetical protein MNEG_9829 [Monoraphidium neglectum]